MKRSPVRRVVLLCCCLTITAVAQQKTTVFEELPALVLSNDKVELTVITEGGAMGQIVLAADKEKINPTLESVLDRAAGGTPAAGELFPRPLRVPRWIRPGLE